jgi:hypothetical protein
LGRSILFSAAFALALTGAAMAAEPAEDRADTLQTASLPTGAPDFVDLVAADFYETELRLSQSRRIEAATAQRYLSLPEPARAQFRAERRRIWREMSEERKAGLRGAKRPRFANLNEAQKLTFRRIAAEELGGSAPGTRLTARGDI